MYKQKFRLFLCMSLFFVTLKTHSQIVASQTVGCVPLSLFLSGPSGATNIFWNLGPGIGTSTLANPNPFYNNPGTYNITYTAIVNGNAVNFSQQIIVNPAPTANFSYVLPANRCAPMNVLFSGSGGSPGSTYNWAFGDLTPLGTGPTLNHNYGNGGSYIPVLTVIDAATGCTAIATTASGGTIQVSNPPNVQISSSLGFIGCVPPFVTNISGSLSASGSPIPGPLSAFNWQFTGGSPSNSSQQTPGAVSFGLGISTISLTVTDNNQCSRSASMQVSVVNPSVTAAMAQTVCINAPVHTTVNTSQATVYWNFGGGSPIISHTTTPNGTTLIDTLTIFTTPGLITYTVFVVAGGNCPPVSQVYNVFVEQVSPNFTWTPFPQQSHMTCQPTMAVNYVNTSSVNNSSTLSYTWSTTWYGTGTVIPSTYTANALNPNGTFTLVQSSMNPYTIFSYFVPHIYLRAQSNSAAGCTFEIFHDVDTIVRPTAWFTMDKKQGCKPLTVRFNDTSFTISYHPNNIALNLYPITGYTWCNGASPPTYSSGVVPLPPSSGSIIPSVSNTYTAAGIYHPYIIIETLQGCRDTSFIDTVIVVDQPGIGSLSFSPNPSACAGQNVQFTLNATPSNSLIQHWHVSTDNNFFSGCVSNRTPIFPFSHVGVHSFTVSAYNHGCGSTSVIPQSITIKGPYGKFRVETNCNFNKKSVKFESHLQEVQTATLSYGDGTFDVLSGNASGQMAVLTTHVYTLTGNYTATLTSVNSITGCGPHTFTRTIKIREPKARITYNGLPLPSYPKPTACTKDRYKFSGITSTDVFTTCCSGFEWFLKTPTYTLHPVDIKYSTFALNNPQPWPYIIPVGGVILDEISLDTFRLAGTYTIGLIIKDENSCTDSVTRIFRVSGAKPSFTFNANPICLSTGSVQIINTTQSNQVYPDTIGSYIWSFGDGSPVVTSTNPFFNPIHNYAFSIPPSQSFPVRCVAINDFGCKDTTIHNLTVNNPLANLQASNLYPCIPKNQSTNVNFSATQGFATYSLSFGDPPGPPSWQTSSTFTNVSHSYAVPGTYVSTLIVVDNMGCKNSEVKTITAIGQATAGFNFVDNINRFCLPGTPTMVSTSSINVSPITNFIWSMGTVVTLGSPTLNGLIITTTGVYTIQLHVNVNGFCPSIDTALVFVFDPLTNFSLNKNKLCLGDTLKVSLIDSIGVYGWQWFFGDNVPQFPVVAGTIGAQLTRTLSYPYTTFPTSGSNGQTVLSLLYYAVGKTCLRTSTTNITVIKLDGDFIQTDNIYKHCLGPPDTFTDQTFNPHGVNLAYTWDFAGLGTSSLPNPSFTFQNSGQFPVTMNLRATEFGCKGTATKNMTIFPLPKAFVSVIDSTCPDVPFVINGSGEPGISGSLTGTINPYVGKDTLKFDANRSFSLSATTSISTIYSLQVSDENNCVSKPATDIIYVPLPAPTINWDTTVIIGELIPINANAGSNFSYSWTPLVSALSCSNCYNPVSSTTNNLTYTVLVQDEPLHCFISTNRYKITIDPKTSLDVPTAFTPNGDGTNDVIYADGWGIRKLVYFKIFNRWGQLLFETNTLNEGWDGRFNGALQNIETYVYQVSAETYLDGTLSKTGTFKLLR